MELAYYPGCSLQQSAAIYDQQTRIVCQEMDIQLREIVDWSCCGATSVSKADELLTIAMAARNIGIAESSGFQEMVIPCSACYLRTLVSQTCLKQDPKLKKKINSQLSKKIKDNIKISSILEPLLTKVRSEEFNAKIHIKLKGLNPVCYYGCMLTRFPQDVPTFDNIENPQSMEKILEALGVLPLDWNYKTACCGASAAVTEPNVAFHLMAKIFQEALARGAECIVTTCPMCQMNLDAYQEKISTMYNIPKQFPVFFLTELLGLALGLDFELLHINKHFIDCKGFLKEKGIL